MKHAIMNRADEVFEETKAAGYEADYDQCIRFAEAEWNSRYDRNESVEEVIHTVEIMEDFSE